MVGDLGNDRMGLAVCEEVSVQDLAIRLCGSVLAHHDDRAGECSLCAHEQVGQDVRVVVPMVEPGHAVEREPEGQEDRLAYDEGPGSDSCGEGISTTLSEGLSFTLVHHRAYTSFSSSVRSWSKYSSPPATVSTLVSDLGQVVQIDRHVLALVTLGLVLVVHVEHRLNVVHQLPCSRLREPQRHDRVLLGPGLREPCGELFYEGLGALVL